MKESCDNANGNEIATSSGHTYGDEVVGRGEVSKGWDEGMEGVKVGGERMLTMPVSLGHRTCGAGALSTPHARSVFRIEPFGL